MIPASPIYIPSFKDYIDVLLRHRIPYVCGLMVGGLLVWFLQIQQQDDYSSNSMIFVRERAKSTFAQGLSQSSSFSTRWPFIQNLIFNPVTIESHLAFFAGLKPFEGPDKGSLHKDYLGDENRYAVRRLVPYSLSQDRWVSLTPYQWWLIKHMLDQEGWVPPLGAENTKRPIRNRMAIAHWFWKNVFNPMESAAGSDPRLGPSVDHDVALSSDEDEAYAAKYAPEGRFNPKELTDFLESTTLTKDDNETLMSKSFHQLVERGVFRGMIPDGFQISFSSSNRRLTRMVVAWATEMIFRFNEMRQHDEIFNSQDLLQSQLEISMVKLNDVRRTVTKFLEENVESYELAMSQHIQDPGANPMPSVEQYRPPENIVRQIYNKTYKDLNESELRLGTLKREAEVVKTQLAKEPPTLPAKEITTLNPDYDRVNAQLVDLRVQRRQELFTKTGTHPHVVDLNRRIEALEGVLTSIARNVLSESEQQVNPRYKDLQDRTGTLETQIAGLTELIEELGRRKAQLRGELRKVPEMEQRMRLLQSELTEHERTVKELQDRINTARREEEYAFALAKVEYTIKVLPSPPDLPKDKLWIHLGMGFVLLIVVSGIMVFASEFMDPSIKEINDVHRHLDANVIGVIPKLPVGSEHVKRRPVSRRRSRKDNPAGGETGTAVEPGEEREHGQA